MNSPGVVTAAVLLALAAGAQAEPGSYAIDPTHTSVTFEANHYGISTNRGRFDKKEGTVQFDRAGRSGKIDMTIETGSLSTGVPALDRRLRGSDFLNAAEFPTARFVADTLNFAGDKVSAIAGSLTLLGKTLPLTLTATGFNCYINPLFKREVCGGDFVATLQRSRWGMTHGLDAGLPDEIRLLIQVEAIRQ